jgi:hypothetical protein
VIEIEPVDRLAGKYQDTVGMAIDFIIDAEVLVKSEISAGGDVVVQVDVIG